MDPLSLILGVTSLVVAGYKLYKQNQVNDKTTQLTQDNLNLNTKVSGQNYELAQEQFEYQKELNQTVMDREDSAYQRQVQDLQKAGLSPLMIGNGANASPLTSAPAPMKDLSGVNTALGNMLNAYNDVFNRNLNKQQFRVQSALNLSNMYTQLAESKLNRDYIKLQSDYLDEKMKWEKTHGFRDLDWKSEALNFIEGVLPKLNKNSAIPSIGDIVTAGPSFSLDSVKNILPKKETYEPGNIQLLSNIKSNKEKVIDEWKYDPDWYPTPSKNISKELKIAFNNVSTRSNPKDEKLNSAINYLWKNTNASEFFLDKNDFSKKIYSDSKYRKNLYKYIRYYIYPDGYFD